MNRIGSLIFVCGLLFGASAFADQIVRCESTSGRQNWCDANTAGGVILSRQLSSAGCWEDQSWGYSSRGIWVSNGCRAEFTVYDQRRKSGASDGEKVALGLLAVGVLGAVIANSNKRDRDRDGGHYQQPGGYYPPPQGSYPQQGYPQQGYPQPPVTLRCESRNSRVSRCDVDTRRSDVQISRQLSSANCQLGYSWGFDRQGIWVSNGCRAEFSVYYYR